MKIERIKNRSIVFKYNIAEWDLNIHLIMGDKYNYIIDTGLGSMSVAPIKEYLGSNQNPIIVINTHHHWDHIWGNSSFKGCTIISHRLCRELIVQKWDKMMVKNHQFIKGNVEMCLPNLVFEDSLYFPDDKIRLIYTPGHTADCISVIDEKDRVINISDNIGDTIDEIVPSIEADKKVYINTILGYKQLDFDTCVSGHNVVFGKEIFDTILRNLDRNFSEI
jgi:glyoxylase-like metal-dependent hydrolase (beta-lactamase superfamily II)